MLVQIGWFRCSTENDCINDWDDHRVAHIDNKTEYVDYPSKYKLQPDGTLTIFDIVPEDDKELFICKGEIQFSGTKDNVTILEIIPGK